MNTLACAKQEELKQIIHEAIEQSRPSFLESVANHDFHDVDLLSFCDKITDDLYIVDLENNDRNSRKNSLSSQSSLTSSDESQRIRKQTVKYPKDHKKCTDQINTIVVNKVNAAIDARLSDTIQILKENYIGTLKRCLRKLEDRNCVDTEDDLPAVNPSDNNSPSQSLQQVDRFNYKCPYSMQFLLCMGSFRLFVYVLRNEYLLYLIS